MTDTTAVVYALVKSLQLCLKVITALSLTEWRFPPTCTLVNGSYHDFIIIGGGGAGCVLANRLTANSSYSVMMVEAGGYSPMESDMAGLFPVLPNSAYDHNITTVNDSRTCQNLRDGKYSITAGKMLGGSTCLGHLSHARGDPIDYNNWAKLLGDNSWNYSSIFKYFKKMENLTDPALLSSSTYSSLHGTDGPIKIARELNSDINGVLAAAKSQGHTVVEDNTSNSSTIGICQPLLQIDNGVRQSAAVAYLRDTIKRSNFCLSLYTTATKVLIENGVAVGIKVVDSSGDVYYLYARKEVIVAAGALNSPKILMHSGIGPADQLTAQNITVVANLSVGAIFKDSPTAVVMYEIADDNSTTPPSNPNVFPAPAAFLYATTNKSSTRPTYQAIILLLPHDSTAIIQICTMVFKYSNTICNKWYAASAGKSMLFAAISVLHSTSNGTAMLKSANYTENLNFYPRFYSDKEGNDIKMMGEALADFHKIPKSMNATLVDLDLCSNTTNGADFWRCYGIAMSTGIWRPIATCAMGSVVDTNLRVKGIGNMSVVDASAIPMAVSANNHPAVAMMAEKAAEYLLNYWSVTV